MTDDKSDRAPIGIVAEHRRTPVDCDGRTEVAAMATAFNLSSLSESDSRLLRGVLATTKTSLGAPIAALRFLGSEVSFYDGPPEHTNVIEEFALACSRATTLARDFIQVEDLAMHPSFGRAAAVTGAPHLRWLATVPVRGYNELVIGSISLFDTRPRLTLNASEEATLRNLAAVVEAALESHRSRIVARAQRALLVKRLRDANTTSAPDMDHRRTIHDLRNALTVIRLNSQAMEESGEYSAEALADIRGSLLLAEKTTRLLKPPTPTPHPAQRLTWLQVCEVQRLRVLHLPMYPDRKVTVIDESHNLTGVASPTCLTEVSNLLVDRALDISEPGDELEVSLRVYPHFVRFAVTCPTVKSLEERSAPVEPVLVHPARSALVAIGGSVRSEIVERGYRLSAWFPLDEQATYVI